MQYLLLAAALATAVPVGAQEISPWRYVHPRAQFVAGLEWGRIAGSEFIRQIKRDMSGAGVTRSGNTDALDAVESVLISGPAPDRGRDWSKSGGLILVRTRIAADRLVQQFATAGVRTQNYNGVPVFIPAKGDSAEMRIAVLGPRHLLAGDWASLRSVITRGVDPPETPLVTRARALAAAHDIWAVGEGLPDAAAMELGVSVGARADISLRFTTAEPEKAAAFAAALQMMAASTGGARGLQVEMAGASVSVRASFTAADLKGGLEAAGRQMAAKMGGMMTGQAGSGETAAPAAAPARPAQPEVPPEKQVIRIHGLEGGVREIPMTPK